MAGHAGLPCVQLSTPDHTPIATILTGGPRARGPRRDRLLLRPSRTPKRDSGERPSPNLPTTPALPNWLAPLPLGASRATTQDSWLCYANVDYADGPAFEHAGSRSSRQWVCRSGGVRALEKTDGFDR